jgi:hypothetical protein
MVYVEIEDQTLRASLAAFFDARFGGSVFDREDAIKLDFRAPAMSPEVELRIVERLLWAWHTQEQLPTGTEALLTASPSGAFASDEQPVSIQLRLQM